MRAALVVTFALMLSASAFGRTKPAVVRRFDPSKPALSPGPLVKIRTATPLQDYHVVDGRWIAGKHRTVWGHVSEAHYTDLRRAIVALLQRFPPDRHVYVGMGRDAAPLVAFLQEISADAVNFPASGSEWNGSPRLDRHFAALIPPSFRRGDRTIVLIDQTWSGKTLQRALPLLRSFLERTRSNVAVRAVAFSSNAFLSNVERIDTSAFPEVDRFNSAAYEGVVAPFERHNPGFQRVKEVRWRPEYDVYRQALGRRIERDRELDTFLSRFAPSGR